MHTGVFLGVGAWLIGAVTATGGSVLAVNALGQVMTPAASQQLSVSAVNQALARESAEVSEGLHPGSLGGQAAAARSRLRRVQGQRPPARRAAPASPPTASGGTVLSSAGGTVVAVCSGRRVYLVSWSPQQGFEATGVTRGPAAAAVVTFTGLQESVNMQVTCHQSTPAAVSSATSNHVSSGGSNSGDD